MKTQKIKQVLLGLIVPAVIVAAWICATHFGSIPTSILPRISMVWQAFLEMLQSGQLWNDLSVTLSRVLKGYLLVIAAVAATAFAPVVLGGSGSRKEQGDNQKSKCFHKPNKIWFFG